MKKYLFLLGVAAMAAMTSCSNDEPVSINKGENIAFRTAMATGSRATETTTATLNDIWVTAFRGTNDAYFTAVNFTKKTGEGADANGAYTFTSTQDYYWPGNTELTFYAWAPETPDGAEATEGETKTDVVSAEGMTYAFNTQSSIKAQTDFVVATAKGSKNDTETGNNMTNGVTLKFAHQLSQIDVQAKNGNENYTVVVSDVRISNVVGAATFNFANVGSENADAKVWTIAEDATKTSFAGESEEAESGETTTVTLTSDAQSVIPGGTETFMLIPQEQEASVVTNRIQAGEGSYISVKITLTLKNGSKFYEGWASVPVDFNWEAGKKYTYILDFSNGAGYRDPNTELGVTFPEGDAAPALGEEILGDPIICHVSVTEWEDAEEDGIATPMIPTTTETTD